MFRATFPALQMKTESNTASLDDDGLASFGGVEDCGKLLSSLSRAESLQSNVQCTSRQTHTQAAAKTLHRGRDLLRAPTTTPRRYSGWIHEPCRILSPARQIPARLVMFARSTTHSSR